MEFSFPYETKVEPLELGGVKLALEQLADLDATIDAFFLEYQRTGREELFGDLCPYFGNPWPAGKALAEVAGREAPRWKGKKVLEIGCGLALPSLVLAALGAEAAATDLHPDVPVFLHRNLERNNLKGVRFQALDWRKISLQNECDILLASDVLYDRTLPDALLRFLQSTTGWTELWLADPDRPYLATFLEQLSACGWSLEEEGVMGCRVFRIGKEIDAAL